jgi:hypothetical protein
VSVWDELGEIVVVGVFWHWVLQCPAQTGVSSEPDLGLQAPGPPRRERSVEAWGSQGGFDV